MDKNNQKQIKTAVFIVSTILFTLIIINVYQKHFNKSAALSSNMISEISINDNDIVFGDTNAPNSIIMFFNYNCGICRNFFSETYPKLENTRIKDGETKLIIKLIDLNQHPDVMKAQQTAICINKYGKFKKLHELLLYNPAIVHSEEFKQLTDEYISNNPEVAECILVNNDYEYLKSNINDFYKNNLTGTPTFVINNHVYKGYKNHSSFMKILNKEFN